MQQSKGTKKFASSMDVSARPATAEIQLIECIPDATEYELMNKRLEEIEARYSALFDRSLECVYIHDFEGDFIDANKTLLDVLGYTRDELLCVGFVSMIDEDQYPLAKRTRDDIVNNGYQHEASVYRLKRKDGDFVYLETRGVLIYKDAKPYAIQGVARDITELMKTEEALKISEEKYRNILEGIEEAYFEVDLAGSFTFFNRALCVNLGYSEEGLLGMSYTQYMDEDNAKKVFDMFHTVYLTGKPTKAFDWELMSKNGGKLYVEASVSLMTDSKAGPIGFRGIVRDITGRKEAEKERDRYEMRLSQAQKMEAIGTLAGGIAHDFNNMLLAIIGYTELVKNEVPEDSKARKNLEQVLGAGMRARELVARILSSSRQFETERESVQVSLILNEALKLLRVTIPSTIEIRETIHCENGKVFADPTEIHQIILNLCTNAYQAMETGGGVLDVSLEAVNLSEEKSGFTRNPDLPDGEYLKLRVSDTGCGMAEDTVKHIFDPLFTTKERGKGTGLGLATVNRIVTDLKGGIFVESVVGKGTTFNIYLPHIVEKQEEPPGS